jgi:anti-sigma B factor antagonist
MIITKTVNGNNVTLAIEGNMDTYQSVQLSDELEKIFSEGAFNIYLDLKELDYISSSGLRVLLAAQKKVDALGTKLELSNANETVKEVMRITGFSKIIKVLQ